MLYEDSSAGLCKERKGLEYFGLPGTLVDLSAFQDPVKLEASILVDGGEGIKIQMTSPRFVHGLQGVSGVHSKREP